MKKIFFIALLLTSGLTYAFAQQSGSCGDNLTWTLDEDGTLTISGTGKMYDYNSPAGYESPWGKEITQLILEEGITSIGNYAFYDCSKLTGILTFPDGLTDIGKFAFYHCSKFTGDLIFPASLTNIGRLAFYGCSGFTGNLTFPERLNSIGDYAFDECGGFTGDLTLPEGLTVIESGTFYGCSGFTGSLTLPEGLICINGDAFYGCSGFTGSLTLPTSLTVIKSGVFDECSGLTGTLILPEGLTEIGASAFYRCSGFTGTLTLPANLTHIENAAFAYCSGFTGTLTLPESLTSIESFTFSNCSGFTGTLTLPERLTSIGENAFNNCSGFTDTLLLPENLLNIGSSAFASCGFSVVVNENKTPIVINEDVFKYLTLPNMKLCVPAGSGTAYSQAEVWKEFNIEEYGVGITPSFSENGGTVDCGTEISISTKQEAELYYGIGKDASPTLSYTGPIVVKDTTYISAYSRARVHFGRYFYSDTIRATYIPEHASFVGMDWDWSAEHKATLSLTCSRCKTELKPVVSLSEELTQEATEEEAGLKTYTAIAIANEVTYRSINREVLPRLTQPIHDTVVKTDTITITEVKTDTIIITDTVYIQVSGNGVEETMNVKLYPNPTNGSFTVEAEEDAYLQIYNAAGVCIQSKRLLGGKFTGFLPASGLYLIKLTARNRTYTKRLVVQ